MGPKYPEYEGCPFGNLRAIDRAPVHLCHRAVRRLVLTEPQRHVIASSRRKFLQTAGLGIGWLATLDLLNQTAAADTRGPLTPKAPPLPATAKSVIHLFMQGGPSQVDTFDPKPLLARLNGQHPPESFGNEDFQNGQFRNLVILASKRTFKKYGESGIEVSDLFPHTSQRVDDLAIIRSCYHEGFTHSQAQFLINNGFARIGRPSLGSW
ncbi:MAG TPA: DUF1501 domain-containing protein, partial [Gemmataceae bacterium]|nr:DUF1501 domain-containing protein [Gemmataceae bacterium]